jgi:hypothetical protein
MIFCADVGSEGKGCFGWSGLREGAPSECTSGTSLVSLAQAVGEYIDREVPVALGFERPLFVPIYEDPKRLTKARTGDGNRAWSAGAGASVLATGLVQTAWLLRRIRAELHGPAAAFLDWRRFRTDGRGLFLWEAFVSGTCKTGDHIADAEAGARAFLESLPEPEASNAVSADVAHSLIGAALLRTGWSCDLDLLSQTCLVIRAQPAHEGDEGPGILSPQK